MIAITTFHQAGYEQYGQRCIETFDKYWPQDVELHVYAEDCYVEPPSHRIVIHDLHAECPELVKFKQENAHRPTDNFKLDSVRFAHKVFSVIHATLKYQGHDRAFWLDADTVTHTHIPVEFLWQCLPLEYYTSCLLRKNNYTECSFVGYNLSHPAHQRFMDKWRRYYTEGRVFTLSQWHDCMTYDAVRTNFEQRKLIRTLNLSGEFSNTSHPFVNCPLGQYMDHLKGARKDEGRSRPKDLKTKREERYWQ